MIFEILGPNRTEDLLVARNEIVSSCIVSFSLFFFSDQFCAEDFSKSVGLIFMKFSGLIDNHKNLIYFFILMTSLPVLRNGNCSQF